MNNAYLPECHLLEAGTFTLCAKLYTVFLFYSKHTIPFRVTYTKKYFISI